MLRVLLKYVNTIRRQFSQFFMCLKVLRLRFFPLTIRIECVNTPLQPEDNSGKSPIIVTSTLIKLQDLQVHKGD